MLRILSEQLLHTDETVPCFLGQVLGSFLFGVFELHVTISDGVTGDISSLASLIIWHTALYISGTFCLLDARSHHKFNIFINAPGVMSTAGTDPIISSAVAGFSQKQKTFLKLSN